MDPGCRKKKHCLGIYSALSGRDEKLAPSDCFYSVSHLIIGQPERRTESVGNEASHLRQKVKTSQNLTKGQTKQAVIEAM